jgi:1,4-dihydroxy-2-naphthoate octaprenyltransferase
VAAAIAYFFVATSHILIKIPTTGSVTFLALPLRIEAARPFTPELAPSLVRSTVNAIRDHLQIAE